MILYRKNFGCNVFWLVLIILSVLVVALGLLAMARDYASCNGQNEYGNICNDPNWCNVNEIRANPANRCPDPTPSPTPVLYATLAPKPDFLGLFWTNFILLLMEIGYITFIVYYWTINVDYEVITEEEEEEEPEPEPEPPKRYLRSTPAAPAAIEIKTTMRTHGIKQRNKSDKKK